MFNPNDPEFSEHFSAFKIHVRDLEQLIRERNEQELFLRCLLAWRSLYSAMDRLNRMKFDNQEYRPHA